MENRKRINIIIALVLIAAALLAGFYMAYERMQTEAELHKTEIVMDWAQITAEAKKANTEPENILSQFAPYISGIIMKEPNVYTLEEDGRALVINGDELKLQNLQGGRLPIQNLRNDYLYVLLHDSETAERVFAAMKSKMHAAYAEITEAEGMYIVGSSLSSAELFAMGIGFDEKVLELASAYNLGVAVQLRGFTDISSANIRDSVGVLQNSRIIGIGFNDAVVPGADRSAEIWKKARAVWVKTLNELNAPLINIEFFKQKGIESLSLDMSPAVVRMHAVSEAEMKKPDIVKGAPQRYQLAAAERNIKIAFVRMLLLGTLDESLAFVKSVNEAIQAKGTQIGPVPQPKELHLSFALLLLLMAGVCAGGYLLGLHFKLGGRLSFALALLAFLGGAGLAVLGKASLVQKLFALCSVLIFLTLSVIHFQPEKGLGLGRAVLQIFKTCLVSLIGAVLMIGLLGDNIYMLKISGFTGVKIAHIIPVLLVLFFWMFMKDRERAPLQKINYVWNYKISVGLAFIGVLAVSVLVFYIARTGNDAVSISSAEQSLRTFLDDVLYVRPRTKEFLLGYPCLLFMYYYGYRDLYIPIMALGVIGQVSLVNTYAHIHTPIVYSLLRSLNGIWLGLLIGCAVLGIIILCTKFYKKHKPEIQPSER